MYKVVVVVVMFAMLASLFTSLSFLFKDAKQAGSRRLWYALGVRIALAVTLLSLIAFGLYSGQLGLNAPWHPGTATG